MNQNQEREDLRLQERLQSLRYPEARQDLWPAVEQRIHQLDQSEAAISRLWPIAVVVVAWRAVQLMFDLPLPLLHPIVPLAAAVWAVWQVAGDPLEIETTAPELQK